MNQKEFNNLREEMKTLQEERTASFRTNKKRSGGQAVTNDWTAADEKRLSEIREKVLKNPPNRSATVAIAEKVTLKVKLATNAEPGTREIRLGAPTGLSNPLVFCVGQLPEYAGPPAKAANPDADRFKGRFGKQPITPPAKPEPRITLPAIVNGQITPGGVDRYRLTAQTGQRLVVAARARALIPYLADAVPGWIQATLALYDAKGRELAYTDDFRFNPDPVLYYEIPKDGDYVVEIKDAIYRGREDFVYRITMGELPFITGIFPLGGPVGEATEVELQGWNLPATKLTMDNKDHPPGIRPLSVRKDEWVSNPVPFAVDALPEVLEKEGSNETKNAQRLALPVIVNGHIDRPGDADVFRIEGRAGDEVVAEVYARRLNSPLDSLLELTDTSGRQIALNDDREDKGAGLTTHHADSYLLAKLPANGTYYLRLSDAQRQGGTAYGYRLRVSPPRPDFELRVVPSSLSARAGATATLTVFALRKDGFTNDITLALKDAPTGFKLSSGRITGTNEQVRLTLSAPFLSPKEPVSLALEGRATIQGETIVRTAVPADDLTQAFAYHHLVPADSLEVAVAGRGRFTGPFGNASQKAAPSSPKKRPKSK
jgi:hypothetical protein